MAWPLAPGSGSPPAWVAAQAPAEAEGHALAPQALLVRWGVAAVQALAPPGEAPQASEPPVQLDGAARVLAPQGRQGAVAPAQRGAAVQALGAVAGVVAVQALGALAQ